MDEQERAARYSDLFASHEHDDPSACALCPICATINMVRSTRPEVVEHLARAAKELLAAASLVLEDVSRNIPAQDPAPDAAPPTALRRIDIG